jgi:hypothetical protein
MKTSEQCGAVAASYPLREAYVEMRIDRTQGGACATHGAGRQGGAFRGALLRFHPSVVATARLLAARSGPVVGVTEPKGAAGVTKPKGAVGVTKPKGTVGVTKPKGAALRTN